MNPGEVEPGLTLRLLAAGQGLSSAAGGLLGVPATIYPPAMSSQPAQRLSAVGVAGVVRWAGVWETVRAGQGTAQCALLFLGDSPRGLRTLASSRLARVK